MTTLEKTVVPAALEPVVSVFEREERKHFTTYEATLTGTNYICGGLPSDPNMIKGWLLRNAGVESGDQQHARLFVESIRNLGADVTQLEQLVATGSEMSEIVDAAATLVASDKVVSFARTELGELAVGARQIKAMIKETAAIEFPDVFFSKSTGKRMENKDVRKGKTLKSLIAEWVYPKPKLIGLGVTEPSEIVSQVGHTSNGAHFSVFEVVHDPWEISFQIDVLHDLIDEKIWPELWVGSQLKGLGANRSMGFGTFKTTHWEKV